MKRKIVILGSTGSIGKSLFNILKKDKDNFEVLLLTANKNIKDLLKQIMVFNVKNIIVTNYIKFLHIKKILANKKVNVYNNFDSLNRVFKNKKADYTMSAISGLDGLEPTLRIIKFSKKIAIANKESIICGWPLIQKELKKNKTKFTPVDSEHYSIYSLLNGIKSSNIDKVYITASGGPFNKYSLNMFKNIKLKSALKHPNWKMGKKITIDSATMMNKVFEIIEAQKIFNIDYKNLKILVHPKSYVHALVRFKNGITKILIHETSMTIPISNSLYEENTNILRTKELDFSIINNLDFNKVDLKKFPVVKILNNLSSKSSLFETIIVTANDKLVNKFLINRIQFVDISKILLRFIKDKEFSKYKLIIPKKIEDITKLSNYVSLKIDSMVV
jgi:1-deoxy-D-xylulose-5-phosphate reductoisomerase